MADPSKAVHYDLLFASIRQQWDDHADDCESLRQFWFGHTGGVSCPSDLGSCDDCGVTFYNEGLAVIDWEAADEVWLCGCCARRRGHLVEVSELEGYVSSVDPKDP